MPPWRSGAAGRPGLQGPAPAAAAQRRGAGHDGGGHGCAQGLGPAPVDTVRGEGAQGQQGARGGGLAALEAFDPARTCNKSLDTWCHPCDGCRTLPITPPLSCWKPTGAGPAPTMVGRRREGQGGRQGGGRGGAAGEGNGGLLLLRGDGAGRGRALGARADTTPCCTPPPLQTTSRAPHASPWRGCCQQPGRPVSACLPLSPPAVVIA